MGIQKKKDKRHRHDHSQALLNDLADFLNWLTANGYSPATVKKRHGDILCLLDYLTEAKIDRLQNVTGSVLDTFQFDLQVQGYSDCSVESITTSARRLFFWLETSNRIFDNPARRMKTSFSRNRKLGLVLTHDQVRKLLEMPDTTKPIGQRDRAMLELLYSTGIRLTECACIKLENFNFEQETLDVHGKGAKDRRLPTGTHAAEYLGVYLSNVRPELSKRSHGDKAGAWFWLSRTGMPLGKTSVRNIVRKYAALCGLPEGTDTHCIRRTCATHLLCGGAPPAVVSELLGHNDLKTLARYLKITVADIRKTHANTNPGK